MGERGREGQSAGNVMQLHLLVQNFEVYPRRSHTVADEEFNFVTNRIFFHLKQTLIS